MRVAGVAIAAMVVALVACGGPAPTGTRGEPTGAPSPSPAPSVSAAAAWEVGPEAPVALIEQATTVHDGRIWTAGGLSADGEAVDTVLILDPASGTWTEGPPVPIRLHHAALISDGTDLWLLGGYLGDTFGAPTDAVRRLPGGDPDGAWVDAPPLPELRAAGAAAWDGERIVYGGGVGPGVLSELVFAGGADGFEPIARLSEPREHLAATSDGEGRSWFLGGRQGSLASNRTRVDLLVGDQVTNLGELSLARGGVAAFHWPSLGACLSGGEAPDVAYRDVECIDAEGVRTSLPPMAEPRHGHGAAVVDGRAFQVFGGHVPALAVSSTVEVLPLP